MTARTRTLLIYVITIGVVSAGFGYLMGRAEKWHRRGWSGAAFAPDVPQSQKGSWMMSEPGRLLFVHANSPADAVFQPYDRITAVNSIPLQDIEGLRKLGETLPGGAPVRYTILRRGKTLDVTLRLGSPLRSPYVVIKTLIAIFVAAVFVGVALLIYIRRPDDPRSVVFYAFGNVSALAVLGSAATMYESMGGRGLAPIVGLSSFAPVVFFLLTVAYAPLVLHLALIFPRERPIVVRHPYIIRWIYAGAILAGMLFITLALVTYLFLGNMDAAERAGRMVGHYLRPVVVIVAVAGLLGALHVIFAGRREGVLRAFALRPFRSSLALFGTLVGIATIAGRYGGKPVGFIFGVLITVGPLILLASYPVFAGISLVRSYRAAGIEEKRQVQWPLWGLFITLIVKAVALAGAIGWSFVLIAVGGSNVEYRTLFAALDLIPTIVSLAIPLSFAAAILKYRLMNIDVIIRKTVVYTILSTVIIIFYLGAVAGLGTLLVNAAGVENQTLVIAATLVVGLAFVPVRNKLQTLVDRNLFRHRYDYPEALRAIVTESRTATDPVEFLASAAEKLQQALHNRAIVIFIERQDEYVAAAKVGVSDTLLGRLRVPRSFAEYLDRPFDPRRRGVPEEIATPLARVETALVVPAGTRSFIAAAPKLSGGEMDVEDIDFLRSAADSIAMAVDRIRMQIEEADFAQARAIQQTLLPREMPRVAKLEVSGMWQPARTMGGDYYDLLRLADHELAVCIGDVAGKGMPAALLMSGLQAAVRASASSSPRDLCERVRRVVVSSLSGGRFVTFFYATVDTAAMRLRWCNAGHNAPILARADGTIVRLAEGGPAISRLFRDTPYEEREIEIFPGDRLVLFTDGVSEAMDASGDMFGEQRIEELVADSPSLTAEELQHAIVDAALAHGGGDLEDDVTLVALRMRESA